MKEIQRSLAYQVNEDVIEAQRKIFTYDLLPPGLIEFEIKNYNRLEEELLDISYLIVRDYRLLRNRYYSVVTSKKLIKEKSL